MPLVHPEMPIDEYIIDRYQLHLLAWLVLVVIAIFCVVIAPWSVVISLLLMLKAARYQIEITNHRIRYRHGMFNTKSTHIGFRDLISIEMHTYSLPFLVTTGSIVLRTTKGKRHTLPFTPNLHERTKLIDHLGAK